jgi:hypothetical protein
MKKMTPKFKRLYLSGPMTDKATGEVSDANIEAFIKAFHYIRQNTPYRIVNPTSVWMCRYPWMYRLLRRLVGSEWAYRLVLLYDLILLMRSDYIYKIPGWQQSRGANIESCVAYHLKIYQMPAKIKDPIDKKIAKMREKYKHKMTSNDGIQQSQ